MAGNDPDRITYFGATDSRGKRVPFGLKAKDRARHMYVIGKTGMGKSTLLENMAIQDIQNGEGMGFIDPHGSAVEHLLNFIPEHRIKDVIYFAPFDLDYPVAFNVMEDVGYDKRHLVVSGLMATFKKIWEDAWSARMEYILTNTLLALLEYPDATLLSVNRMYTDKTFRKTVVDNIKDPVVKDFWTKEFANFSDTYTKEATPAIQNKIGQFTGNPLIRNIIGQPKSSFDIREIMDGKKILLMNLSKGLVGETNMRLLGSMLVTRIFLGAMSRADLPSSELKNANPFYFFVDEFQNFANESFSEILSEARKYNLNLLVAHQYVAQMEEEVQAAVFGNVGTTVSFRVGPLDAELLEKVFTPEFLQEDLVNLGFAQIYLSLMIDGVGSRPFSAVTIPPIEPPKQSFREQVLEASRKSFAGARASVEAAIFEELTTGGDQGPPEPPPKKKYGPPQNDAPRREQAPAPRRDEGPARRDTPPAPRRDDGQAPRRNDAPRNEGSRNESVRNERPERQTESPRRDERSQAPERRDERRDDRRDDRPRPEGNSPQKTAEDLKAILRNMSKGADTDREKKVQDTAAPLKSALADMLKKAAPTAPASSHEPSDGPRQPKPSPTPPPAPQPRLPAQDPITYARRPQEKVPENKPFEVPEETLRAIFSDQK